MKVQQPKYSIEYCLKGISFAVAANSLGIWQSWLLYWCCSKQYLVPSDSKRPILVCRGIHYWASKEAVKFPFLSVLKETWHLSGTTQKNSYFFPADFSCPFFALIQSSLTGARHSCMYTVFENRTKSLIFETLKLAVKQCYQTDKF